ncbi:hypothetical protein MAP00_003280 [Monascus purpureus]|nr:hypothetical protein MAP00_003280 [Monascus purpureus]
MEEIEGMFSSPERSPVKYNGLYNENETAGSEGMSMDEGSAPGPADFLKGRRASYFPPPVARSPVKTGLSGSPRRTPRLRSSSPRRDIPSSGTSEDQSREVRNGSRRQDSSPLSNRHVNASSYTNGLRSKGKSDSKAFRPDTTVDFSDSDEDGQLNGDENMSAFDQTQDDLADGFGAANSPVVDGQDVLDHVESAYNNSDENSPSVLASDSRRSRRGRPASKTKNYSPARANGGQGVTQHNTATGESQPKRKRPGRPPKSQNKTNNDGAVDRRPSKRAKTSDEKRASTLNPELDKVVENYANSHTGPLKGRSLYILKRESPSDSNATHTRSGRVSVRPVAFWRNERCVYGSEEAAEGQRFPVLTIKEVIRTEELPPEKRNTKKRNSSKKTKPRKRKEDESEDEDDYLDPWEKEGGVLHGYVRKWDSETQTGIDEEEILDIAYAPSGIETRDTKDSSFRFAKLLSSPFLGSGIVELPPGGVKKPKNSKRMHMLFYVCRGRIQVDVSGVQFSAGKGCVFQVPRGIIYCPLLPW